MKLRKIASAFLAITVAAASFSVQAAYNVYKKDGLSLDINGRVAAEYQKRSQKLKITNQDIPHYRFSQSKNKYVLGTLEREYEEDDRRSRLGYNNHASYLQIRGKQRIDENMHATGTVQIGYHSSDNLYLSQANVALDYRNWGTLSVGKQYLHTGYVSRTGTFYPLDSYGNSSIRADFTAVPNLTLSAFHLFPGRGDTRRQGYDVTNGSGFSGSYLYSFAPDHSLRVAAGVSRSKVNVPEQVLYRAKKSAVASSLEYRFRKLTLAADVGREDEDYKTNLYSEAKANSWGVKAEYDFTERFRAALGYGRKVTKRNRTDGFSYVATALQDEAFNKTQMNRYYVKADYDLRENVSIYGRFDLRDTKNTLIDKEFSKRRGKEVTAGIAINF